MIQNESTILWNHPVGPGYYHIGLTVPPDYRRAAPGQFVMLRVAQGISPLLRRPFSIHRLVGEPDNLQGIEILYKVVGKGTQRLSRYSPGGRVDLLGPLGNGFTLPPKNKRIYLAAGGIGVAPMLFLGAAIRRKMAPNTHCTLFLGGKSENDLLCRSEFAELGITVHLTTDDGSTGEMCLLTDPLEVAVHSKPPDIIYACGPTAMLKCVIGIAQHHQIPCQVSTETTMACGIGACLGCAVEDAQHGDTYLHTCLNGPVFDANRIAI